MFLREPNIFAQNRYFLQKEAQFWWFIYVLRRTCPANVAADCQIKSQTFDEICHIWKHKWEAKLWKKLRWSLGSQMAVWFQVINYPLKTSNVYPKLVLCSFLTKYKWSTHSASLHLAWILSRGLGKERSCCNLQKVIYFFKEKEEKKNRFSAVKKQ